jgi:hypothetical protein
MPLTTRRAGYAFAERGAGGGSSVDAKRGGICPARRSRVPVHESHERTTVKTARPTEASSRPYERKSSPSSHHRKAVRTQKLRKHGLGLSCFDADCLLEFCLGSLSLYYYYYTSSKRNFLQDQKTREARKCDGSSRKRPSTAGSMNRRPRYEHVHTSDK